MKLIEKKSISLIRVIAGSINEYDIRYNDLRKKLRKNNLFHLFAEPLVVGGQILWRTPLRGKITKYANLQPEEQKNVDEMLKEKANDVINVVSGKIKADKIEQYLTFPSKKDIYIIDTKTGKNVVITQWGCVPDNANQMPVTIIKGEKFPVPVIFVIKYTDGTPAPNENIFIHFNNKTNEDNSGKNAKIDFGKVIMNTKIKVFQLVEDKEMFVHNINVDNRGEYIIEIPPLQTMKFIVKDTNGELKSGYSFNFEYNNNETKQVANENAIIEIEKIKVGTEVKAFHKKTEQKLYQHSFVCQTDREEYILIVPAPEPDIIIDPDSDIIIDPDSDIIIDPDPDIIIDEPKDIKIKLIDHKNKPIANQEINFKHKEKEYKLITDDEGYCILTVDEIEKNDVINTVIEIVEKKKDKKTK